MSTRKPEFGEPVVPVSQSLLRTPQGDVSQEHWLLMVCRDKEFYLCDVAAGKYPVLVSEHVDGWLPYSELWAALAGLELGGRKHWLIGWRMRYALDAADFCGALARGDVALPKIRIGKNKGRHGGKLTINGRIVEVDVVCGRNKIKMLDWSNFGVKPPTLAGGVACVSMEDCENTMLDLFALAGRAKMIVNKTSAAQLGWNHARRTTNLRGLHVNRDGRTRELERASYHAGRCECFRLGDVPGVIHSLDVKSCYATICRDELLPCRVIEEYRLGLPVGRVDPNGKDQWIADVVVKTDSPDYPLRWQGSPVYPVGQFRTALPWPELRHALRAGRVMAISRAARYEAAPVLQEYAEWYLRMRASFSASTSAALAGPLKAIFNASLGYTAREKYDWVPWHCQLGHPYWIGTTINPEDRNGVVSAQKLDEEKRWLKIDGEPREAMPFLHATICSYARALLLRIMRDAGAGETLYCDTDGVLVTTCGVNNLRDAGRGADCYRYGLVRRFKPGACRIQGQKSYSVGTAVIQSGVPKTRYDGTLKRSVPTTDTGRVAADGRIVPYEFRFVGGKNQLV